MKNRHMLYITMIILILLISFLIVLSSKNEEDNNTGKIVEIDEILKLHWQHVKTHVTDDNHPALITVDPKNPDMMIPYAFGDGGDLDNDGKYAYHENKKSFELLVVSESASYALLRALWMDDREVFDKVWKWIYHNLQHKNIKQVYKWNEKNDSVSITTPEKLGLDKDHLFAWRWTPTVNGKDDGVIVGTVKKDNTWVDGWGFASDADEDIALALIMADSRWGSNKDIFDYSTQAKLILNDLWEKATVVVNGKRYLNGGTGSGNNIEPGYLSPASYRIFEDFDPDHSWIDLVDTSYEVFYKSAQLTMMDGEYKGFTLKETGGKGVGLVPDWVEVKREGDSTVYIDSTMRREPEFGADAFRAYWRIALDYIWFNSKEAYEIIKEDNAPIGPHNFIKKMINDSWENDPTKNYPDEHHKIKPYDYDEKGKLPRIMAHNGGYIANEVTGAGIDESDTGNRADIGAYAVWLAYFYAAKDKETSGIFLDPIIRKDINPHKGMEKDGYKHGYDGWLREDKDGYYWTIHDMNIWSSDTEYYSNAWGWFGLALYSGRVKNYYNNYNSEPKSIQNISLYKTEGNDKILMKEIDDIDILIEVEAKGGNAGRSDFLYMDILCNNNDSDPVRVKCRETGDNTNVYISKIRLDAFSNDALDSLYAPEGSMITFKTKGKTIRKTVKEITYGNKTLFDSCDGNSNLFGGYWYSAVDKNEGHKSVIYNEKNLHDNDESIKGKKVNIEYELKAGKKNKDSLFALAGTQLYNPDKNKRSYIDLSEFKGMGLWIKGNGHELTITLKSDAVKDYDDYSYIIESTPDEWRYFILKFDESFFKQGGWGRYVPFESAVKNVVEIQFKASSKNDGEKGYFAIDDISFLGVPSRFLVEIDDFDDGDISDWWKACDSLEGDEITQMPVMSTDGGMLNIEYQMGSKEEVWACLGKNVTPRNLKNYNSISMDVYGRNSHNPFIIELADTNGERFAINLRDDFTGKKTFLLPFKYLKPRSWQPDDADINNVLEVDGVNKIAVNFLTGKGKIGIDNIKFAKDDVLYPQYKPMTIDFEDGTLYGFIAETEGIKIFNDDEEVYKGEKSLKLFLNGTGKQSIKYGLPSVKINQKIVCYIYIPENNNIKGVNFGVLDKDYRWGDKWMDGAELKPGKFNKIEFIIPSSGKDKNNIKSYMIEPIQMLKIEFHPDEKEFKDVVLYIDEISVVE